MTAKPSPVGTQVGIQQILETMRLRFSSGNSIPVQRAHINADEWQVLNAAFVESQTALSQMRSLLEAKAAKWKKGHVPYVSKKGHCCHGDCADELLSLAATLEPGEMK